MLFRESPSRRILFPNGLASASGVAQNKSLINAFASTESDGEIELSPEKLAMLHIHLGHAPLTSMTSTLEAAGRNVDTALIEKIIFKFGCYSARSVVGRGVANTHRSPFPGYTVYFDVVYLRERTRRDYPILFVVDGFSRFIACFHARSIRPSVLISPFSLRCAAFFGSPRFLIRDGWPVAVGKEWSEFPTAHNACLISSPKECPTQMGSLGRHVGLLKIGISRI